MHLSVLMLTKNNRDVLPQTLESIQGLWDELLVSDHASSDGTRDLLTHSGATIVPASNDHFGDRKSQILKKAKGDWILVLDADEQVSKKLYTEIRNILSSKHTKKERSLPRRQAGLDVGRDDKHIVAYEIPYQNYVFGKKVHWGGEQYSKVRLFRRGKGTIEKKSLHEEIVVKGTVEKLHGVIHHHSYRSPIQLFRKFTQYAWTAAKAKLQLHESLNVKKLFLYGPHMLWARLMKDQGYKDGWRGFILATAFGYMEGLTYWFVAWQQYWRRMVVLSGILCIHLGLLLSTTFIDWPEMLVYPWFLTRDLVYYRDVTLAYVPGAYYILYGLYTLLGFSPLSLRLVAYGFLLMSDIILFFLSLRLFGRLKATALILLLYVSWEVAFDGNTIWYETIMLPLYLSAYWGLVNFLEKKSRNGLFLASICLGITMLIKQTSVWIAIGVVIFLWFTSESKQKALRAIVQFSVIPICLSLASLLYFIGQQAGAQYIFWSYFFPLTLTQSNMYYILPPTPSDLVYLLPAYMPIGILFMLVCIHKEKRHVLHGVFFVALVFSALPRFGMHRLIPSLAFSLLSFGYLFRFPIHKQFPRILVVGCCIVFLVLSGKNFWKFLAIRDKGEPQFFDAKVQLIAQEVAQVVHTEKFFVYGNYDYLYYLLNVTPTVLPWTPLFPWNANISGVQEVLVKKLEESQMPYIIFIPYHANGYYLDYRPSTLDWYIHKHYQHIRSLSIGGSILKRMN